MQRSGQARTTPVEHTQPGTHREARARTAVWAITLSALAYATIRYNVFKGVPWSDWPVYVVNKAVALSSLLLLLAWILRARRGPGDDPTGLLSQAGRFAVAHAGLSLAILAPAYFPTFFVDGRLNWASGLSILLGVMAASGLYLTSRPAVGRPGTVRGLGAVGLVTGIHAMLNGYGSWLAPATWPGFMPPITLISFAAGAACLGAALRLGRRGA